MRQKRSQRGAKKHEFMPAQCNIASSEKSSACSTLSYEFFRPSLNELIFYIKTYLINSLIIKVCGS